MAHDSTITYRNHMFNQNASYSMILQGDTRVHNIYLIYGYGMIEYTYLVGNTQTHTQASQTIGPSSGTVTYNKQSRGKHEHPISHNSPQSIPTQAIKTHTHKLTLTHHIITIF